MSDAPAKIPQLVQKIEIEMSGSRVLITLECGSEGIARRRFHDIAASLQHGSVTLSLAHGATIEDRRKGDA